jgi:hypothetical protein
MSIDNDAVRASINNDAERFGRHFEGGWKLGLYVARNVYKQPHSGRPPKSEPVRIKVSCAEFGAMAGVSDRTVQLYYDAWELAAEAGHCTPAEELGPGDEDPLLELDNSTPEHRELWRKFYRQGRESTNGSESTQPSQTGSKPGSASTSTKDGTPDTKVGQAMEALANTSEQLSKNLVKVVAGVGTKLMGDDAALAKFAEDLRQTRAALDQYCRDIDQLLERIGFGDTEDQSVSSDADVKSN